MYVEVLTRIPAELWPCIDRWNMQEPSLLDSEIVAILQQQMDDGDAVLLRCGYAYAYLIRATPWRAEFHVYHTGASNMVASFRALSAHALTLFHRIEGRFHNIKLAALARRCGWQQEAVYTDSFRLPDGRFIDEYGVALCRE